MIQRIYRIVFVLFLIAGASQTFAQAASSDIGVWLVQPRLNDTTPLFDEGADVTIDFDEDLGYGVSYNRFWTGVFSTEFGAQRYGADMTLGVPDGPEVTVGELEVTSLSAMGQLHFNRTGRFSVFAGAGVAYMSGDFDPADELEEPEDEDVDIESELTWAAAVGANLSLTERFALTGEIRYTPWSAQAEGDSEDDAIDVDPLTFSAGVRFRF